MKNLMGKKLMGIALATTVMAGTYGVNAEAKVIQKGSNTYITLDATEKQENSLVLKRVFKVKKFNVSTTKNTYTVKYKSNKSSKQTEKQVNQIAEKLHGVNIEKKFKEYRTYKIKVVGVDKQGSSHTKTIDGHKIK